MTYHCLNSEAYGTRLMLYTGDEVDTVESKYKKSTRLFTQDECVSRFTAYLLFLVDFFDRLGLIYVFLATFFTGEKESPQLEKKATLLRWRQPNVVGHM